MTREDENRRVRRYNSPIAGAEGAEYNVETGSECIEILCERLVLR